MTAIYVTTINNNNWPALDIFMDDESVKPNPLERGYYADHKVLRDFINSKCVYKYDFTPIKCLVNGVERVLMLINEIGYECQGEDIDSTAIIVKMISKNIHG